MIEPFDPGADLDGQFLRSELHFAFIAASSQFARPRNIEMFARAVARKGLKPVPKKALLSLRIDAEVIAWFRSQGSGYQSRMNALLRASMEANK
jgi:uncharacterized protein (DUF4415 family)